jgi:hypothetical protein
MVTTKKSKPKNRDRVEELRAQFMAEASELQGRMLSRTLDAGLPPLIGAELVLHVISRAAEDARDTVGAEQEAEEERQWEAEEEASLS